VLHKERRPPLAIVEVREHGARQELLPHRLPEAFDLAAGLRMVRPALHVPDALAAQLLFKPRLPPPRGVLAPLVGEDLARRSVVGDPSRECLEHQRAPLVVRHHEAHEVARMVIQKRRHVHPLVPSQQEREQIRLPQLIGLGTLKAPRRGLRPRLRHRTLGLLRLSLQHPAYRRLGGPDAEEAPQHIANAPAPGLRLLALYCEHRGCAVTHRHARSGG
jgi:hypothetical protein